jgi:hypothetical protein
MSEFKLDRRRTANINEQTGKELKLQKNYLDITELIRSIQRAEGNPDCFRRAHGNCDRLDCAWRNYCLQEPQDTNMNATKTHEDNSGASIQFG